MDVEFLIAIRNLQLTIITHMHIGLFLSIFTGLVLNKYRSIVYTSSRSSRFFSFGPRFVHHMSYS
jgi:hypothetical protein